MKDFKDALIAIASGSVQAVNETSTPNASVVRELMGAGFVEAKDGSADDGLYFAEPVITFRGRQFMNTL